MLNGDYREDEEGEWTYVGERNSIIDYVIGDNRTRRTRERIVEFKIGSGGSRIDVDLSHRQSR